MIGVTCPQCQQQWFSDEVDFRQTLLCHACRGAVQHSTRTVSRVAARSLAIIVRLLIATLFAGLMAVLPLQILESWQVGQVRWVPQSWLLLYFVVPYMAFWALMALLLRHQTYLKAAGVGLVSPLICSSYFFILGWLVVIQLWYIAFPIGIATGILVRWCVSEEREQF